MSDKPLPPPGRRPGSVTPPAPAEAQQHAKDLLASCPHLYIDPASNICTACGVLTVTDHPDKNGVRDGAYTLDAKTFQHALTLPPPEKAALDAAAQAHLDKLFPPNPPPDALTLGRLKPETDTYDALDVSNPLYEPDSRDFHAGGPRMSTADVLTTLGTEARSAEPLYSATLGTAGTGKTYQAREAARTRTDVILCATTGIAAINIGGRTLNSLLWYYDTDSLRLNYEMGKLKQALRKIADSGYRRLFIDEVSMMDGRQLDYITLALDDLNQDRAKRDEDPLGISLIGDFAQLPPVKAPFVFERPAWDRFKGHITVLTEPRRQADPDFVRALQAVRRGDKLAAAEYFAPKITQKDIRDFDGSTILAKNDEVDRYNAVRLLELKTAEHHFPATKQGTQDGAWKNVPDVLTLKPGSLVMILANKRESEEDGGEMIYANGSLGTYVDTVKTAVYDEDGVTVTGHTATGAIVTLKETGADVVVPYLRREKTEITGAKGVKTAREKVLGSIEYLPLRVAYATTCHKSQGLSLDRVQINFHSVFWASPSMMYVALSRARTPEGLHLVGTIDQFRARITVSEKVRRWL